MPAFYNSKGKASFGTWGSRCTPGQVTGLVDRKEDTKYVTEIHTWAKSGQFEQTSDGIPILDTIVPIVHPTPVQSLIITVRGDKTEKKFAAILKSLDCEDFVLYDRSQDWSCFQITFLYPYHFLLFIRRASDLIHPLDPLYKFRHWRFLQIPVCIQKKRGFNLVNLPEHDPFRKENVEDETDVVCFNPDLNVNAAINAIVNQHHLDWTNKVQHKFIEMKDGGDADFGDIEEPDEKEWALETLYPNSSEWIQYWMDNDTERKKTDRRKNILKGMRDNERLDLHALQIESLRKQIKTSAAMNEIGRSKPCSSNSAEIPVPSDNRIPEPAESRQNISLNDDLEENPRGYQVINSQDLRMNRKKNRRALMKLRKKGVEITTRDFAEMHSMASYHIAGEDETLDMEGLEPVSHSTKCEGTIVEKIRNLGESTREMFNKSLTLVTEAAAALEIDQTQNISIGEKNADNSNSRKRKKKEDDEADSEEEEEEKSKTDEVESDNSGIKRSRKVITSVDLDSEYDYYRLKMGLKNFYDPSLIHNKFKISKKEKKRRRKYKRIHTKAQVISRHQKKENHIIRIRDQRIEKRKAWDIINESFKSKIGVYPEKNILRTVHDCNTSLYKITLDLGQIKYIFKSENSFSFDSFFAWQMANCILKSGQVWEGKTRGKKVKVMRDLLGDLKSEGKMNAWAKRKFLSVIDEDKRYDSCRELMGERLRLERVEVLENWAKELDKRKVGELLPIIEGESGYEYLEEEDFKLKDLLQKHHESGIDNLPVNTVEKAACVKAVNRLSREAYILEQNSSNDKKFKFKTFFDIRRDLWYHPKPIILENSHNLDKDDIELARNDEIKEYRTPNVTEKVQSTSQNCHQHRSTENSLNTDLEENVIAAPQKKFYHHWYSGKGYDILRQKEPDYLFANNVTDLRRKRNDKIKVMYMNMPCQKIKKLENQFEKIVNHYGFIDIFMLCEMRWDRDKHVSVCPEGYTLIYNENTTLAYTGILIKNSDRYTITKNEDILNCTRVQLTLTNGEVLGFTTFYRSPTHTEAMYSELVLGRGGKKDTKQYLYVKRLAEYFDKIIKNDNVEIFGGDLNVEVNGDRPGNHEKLGREVWGQLPNGLAVNLLKKLVTNPKTGTNIDILMLNRPDRCSGMTELNHLKTTDISDHKIFHLSINVKTRLARMRYVRAKSKIKPDDTDLTKFTKLATIQEETKFTWDQTENAESAIETIAEQCSNLFPIKIFQSKPNSKLLESDPEVKKIVLERDEYIKTHKLDGIGRRFWLSHKKLFELNKDISREKVRAKKRMIEKYLGGKTSKKTCWEVLKILKNRSDNMPDFVNVDNTARYFRDLSWGYTPKLISISENDEDDEDEEEANEESEDETEEEREDVKKYRPKKKKFKIEMLSSTSQEYFKNIQMLIKDGKGAEFSYGPDEVTLNLIKRFDSEGWKTLKDIVNDIIFLGRYPECFRNQKQVPVKKKPIISSLKDLRPVTVSNCLANLVEKIMTKWLYRHAEENGWLHELQSGFRSGYSIGQLISRMRKTFARSVDTKKCVLLTDLSNAFGSPDTELIINHLRSRLTKQTTDLLKGFLSQSAVFVEIDGKRSAIFHTAGRGFAQGSTLSPLMFCIIMSGTHLEVDNIGFSFADDCQFICGGKNEEELRKEIEKTVSQFDLFCESWNIKLNVSKTWYVYSKDLKIKYKNVKVKNKKESKVLGYRIDHHLSIGPQVKWVCNSIGPISHAIRKMRNYVTIRGTGIMIGSFLYGRFNHANAHIGRWHPSDYDHLQAKVTMQIKTKASGIILRDYRNYENLDDEGKVKIDEVMSQIDVYNRKLETNHKLYLVPLPQWFLLREAGLLKLDNNHVLLKLKKLGKLALTARPVTEFRELVKYMTKSLGDNRRNTSEYIYFRPMLKKDESRKGLSREIIQSTAPQVWIEEFEDLDHSFRKLIGRKDYDRAITKKMKEECQHNSSRNEECRNCGVMTGRKASEDMALTKWTEAVEQTILVLRDESLELVRIRPEEIQRTDVQVELEMSDHFLMEVRDNLSLRSRLGLTTEMKD